MNSPRKIGKKLKISLLGIARKNKLFLQYPVKKFNDFFLIVLGSLQKTEISLSDSVVIFSYCGYYRYVS